MESWKHATEADRRIFKAISILLSNHLNLLDFLFRNDEAKLNGPSDKILKNSLGLSKGERVLIQISLDMWSGSGGARFLDILNDLDPHNVSRFILTLRYINAISPVGATPSSDY